MRRWIAVTALLVVLGVLLAAPYAAAAVPPQGVFRTGAVVALAGTSHVWVADDGGMLHWVGDTRALANRTVDWGNRIEVGAPVLAGFVRGAPWLSAGLLRLGESIYLAKWETDQTAPTLLRVASVADLELFGVDGRNYGALVLDQLSWEQRYGFRTESLPRGELARATPPPAPTPTPTPTGAALVAELVDVAVTGDPGTDETEPTYRFATTVEVRGAAPGVRLRVSAVLHEYACTPRCTPGRRREWGPIDAGVTDSDGTLQFVDRHSPYAGYTYVFEDPAGHRARITVDDDLRLVD